MLQEERLHRIEERVNARRFCSVEELAAALQSSKSTIRRDLRLLEAGNRLRLSRGGAASLAPGTAQEPPYGVKARTNHEEKVRIGQAAAGLIERGETVVIDSGTTALELAAAMRGMRDVTVATNDVRVACELAECGGVDVTVIGGSVRKGYFTALGSLARHALEAINADKAFLCVDALDVKKGCMVTNDAEAMVKRMMLESANRKIVICDHSKFENVAFMRLCAVGEIDMIITGRELGEDRYGEFLEAGVNITLV